MRRNKWSQWLTIESVLKVSVKDLSRSGFSRAPSGTHFTITWFNPAFAFLSFLFDLHRAPIGGIDDSSIVFSPIEKNPLPGCTVKIVRTNCFFGGERNWFVCPRCSTWVGTLFIAAFYRSFECRTCFGLTYESVRKHDNRILNLIREGTSAIEKALTSQSTARRILGIKGYSKMEHDRTGKYWDMELGIDSNLVWILPPSMLYNVSAIIVIDSMCNFGTKRDSKTEHLQPTFPPCKSSNTPLTRSTFNLIPILFQFWRRTGEWLTIFWPGTWITMPEFWASMRISEQFWFWIFLALPDLCAQNAITFWAIVQYPHRKFSTSIRSLPNCPNWEEWRFRHFHPHHSEICVREFVSRITIR